MTKIVFRKLTLPDPSHTLHPREDYHAAGAIIGMRLARTRRRLDIMSALATGYLPWGVEWGKHLRRARNQWILCCGHTLNFTEAQAFVSAGLLTPAGTLPHDILVITEAGRTWLARNWSAPAKPPAPRPAPWDTGTDEQPF